MDRCSHYPPLADQSPGLRRWETWLPLLSGGPQWTQLEGFQSLLPNASHPCSSCAPVHNISLMKETGNLGVSGDSLLGQVIFPRCLESVLFRQGLCRKGSFLLPVFPASSSSSVAGGGFLDLSSHSLCARVLPSGLRAGNHQPLSASLPYNCCQQGGPQPNPAMQDHWPEPTARGK